MKGDFTRATFKPERHYHGVLKQQGRVDLDADWNEQGWITTHRIESETIDVVGKCGAPIGDAGFVLTPASGGTNLSISAGRAYVDGILCENEQSVLITNQPDLPGFALPKAAGVYIAYLEVWLRHIISLDDPGIREVALGGPDTCTRAKTVWQVGLLNAGGPGTTVDCTTPVPDWTTLSAPSTGILAARAEPDTTNTDPCIIPAKAGYRRLENQLYRIEIHDPGTISASGGTVTFKWSRDNGSIVTSWTGQSGNDLTVASTGPDSVLGFAAGQWVELIDDTHELNFQPGTLVQLVNVQGLRLTINPATASGPVNIASFPLNPKIRRWDSAGLVPVNTGSWLDLEDGVQVQFGNGTYFTGDYWLIPARTLTADVEWPRDTALNPIPEFPKGIRKHFCRLAIVQFDGTAWSVLTPCLPLFPPLTDLGTEGCDCTVCVTADSHNSDHFTIKDAIKKAQGASGTGGGKVCLAPGIYNIKATITIDSASAILISGHGLPLLQATPDLANNSPIIVIKNSLDIAIEDISLASATQSPSPQPMPGIEIADSTFVYIHRCAFGSSPGGSRMTPAISLGGKAVLAAQVEGNFFNGVGIGIGFSSGVDLHPVVSGITVEGNEMICTEAGVWMSGLDPQFQFRELRFDRNYIQSPVGISLTGRPNAGLDVTIERNTFVVSGREAKTSSGITCSASQTRILNNEIFGDGRTPNSNGIALGSAEGKLMTMYGVQVVGNHISGLPGTGILISNRCFLIEAIITQNQLLNLGQGGIVMELVSFAIDITISGNSIVGAALDPNPTDTRQPLLVGIQLMEVINASVLDNSVENVALKASPERTVGGILLWLGIGARFTGNRILNIGPIEGINPSSGLGMISASGRVDVADNEVRRALAAPTNAGNTLWSALALLAGTGDLSVRGNLLESFGPGATVLLSFAGSCIFSDNQCQLDNPQGMAAPPFPVQVTSQTIIASANRVHGGHRNNPNTAGSVSLNTGAAAPNFLRGITVLGNITTDGIVANGAALTSATLPWGPLNIIA
jgi:Family of unknown function (DUF6519)/Right handed beta helix region